MATKVQDWKAEAENLDDDGIDERLAHYEQLRQDRLNQRRREALNQIKEIMAAHELTIDDIAEDQQPSKKAASTGRKMPAKYRDHETGKTWTGQGIAPRWMPENKEEWGNLLINPE